MIFSAIIGLLLLEIVIGKRVSVENCTVHWLWEEPQTVGKTVSFDIKVMYRWLEATRIQIRMQAHCYNMTVLTNKQGSKLMLVHWPKADNFVVGPITFQSPVVRERTYWTFRM